MDVNFVLILCIALIFAADTTIKVDGEAEVVSNSNLTDSRFVGSGIVSSTNATDSKNTTDDTKLGGDGSKIKSSEEDSSKSEVNKGSDESEDSNKDDEEGMSNSSRKKKEGFHGEVCDPSNMCTDEDDQFVACLRVPGNDAPHLSLLIQNKGKSALLVTITAPGFVRLEKNKVQLLENEDTKVKVSVNKGRSNDSAIMLTSSKGSCRLELKDLAAAHETGNDDTVTVSHPSTFNIRPRTIIVITMISFLVLSLVIIPVIIHVYRNKTQGKNKYQRLDMELPVSNNALVSKSDHESGDDGWNNNWGDDWDDENGDGDEEQPHTPVLPLTPSVSARGLASRRLSKEGWKD
ncbi:unnamed protein product [Arabis nemorensis]|uniref:DUF7356 domain-containing protein n=1 Tax=Arabis nemorensis TaxID=586526 RepID=A0A565AWN6_9BRAS|nr:unnamed protein product [Arabis nemorensis]